MRNDDLDAIRARHLRPEQMEHRTFYEGHIVIDLAALVDEIERLRMERSAVVAWLRAECGSPGHEDRFCAYCNVRRNIAADIERGEHRREEET